MHFVLRVSLRLLKIAPGDFGSALPKRYTSVTAPMATYWHALRRNGIMDWFEGFGALMEEY